MIKFVRKANRIPAQMLALALFCAAATAADDFKPERIIALERAA